MLHMQLKPFSDIVILLSFSLPPEATDSSSEGSFVDDGVRIPPQPKHKSLKTRRSILDHLDDNAKATPTNMPELSEQMTPAKRAKTDEEVRSRIEQ